MSACTIARDSVPRGFDWISALICSSFRLLVALEGDPVDHLGLDHGDDQAPARPADADVLKKAGGDQCLEAIIDPRCIELAIGARLEVGPNGIGFDPPIAFDHNRLNGLSDRNVLRCNMKNGASNGDPAEDYAEIDQPSHHPHTKSHA